MRESLLPQLIAMYFESLAFDQAMVILQKRHQESAILGIVLWRGLGYRDRCWDMWVDIYAAI